MRWYWEPNHSRVSPFVLMVCSTGSSLQGPGAPTLSSLSCVSTAVVVSAEGVQRKLGPPLPPTEDAAITVGNFFRDLHLFDS